MQSWLHALEAALPGRVVTDAEILEAHRHDHAGLADAGVATALVRARTTQEVQAVMRVAYEHRVPVVPRGAGSGLAGGANAIDGCIVLSLAAMNQIVEIDPGDPNSEARARQAFDDILHEALRLGDTVTGEHGVGTLKRQALGHEIGPVSPQVHRSIKDALDPRGILNPGKSLPDTL